MYTASDKQTQMTLATMQSMLKNLSDLVFIKNTDLIYIGASDSFVHMVGAKSVEDIIGKRDTNVFDSEETAQRYIADDMRVIESGKPLTEYIESARFTDGRQFYFRTSKFPLYDEQGKMIGVYGISRDVTHEYRVKLNYDSEVQELFNLPPDGLGAVLFDITNWEVLDAYVPDQHTYNLVDFSSVDRCLQNCIDCVIDDEAACNFYRSLSAQSLQHMFEEGKRRLSIEYQCKVSDSCARWVRDDLHFIFNPMNGSLCMVSIVRDIDESKQAAYALARAAERDALTGVLNRETTMSHLYHFLSEAGATGTHLLFMVDVDNFKLVNDTLGHQTGDEALIHIASVIQKNFRETDIVGRIGGDEFFALMKDATDPSEVTALATNLVEALQYQCSNGRAFVDLSGSVGISRYTGDGKTLENLYAEADAALYKAKQAGKNRFVFADSMLDVWQGKAPLNTVNLRVLLENMDASVFQTELDSSSTLCISYSSHSLFSDEPQNVHASGARGENIWSALVPEDRDLLQVAIQVATLNKTVVDCICRVVNPKEQIEWRHVRGTHLPEQGDGVQRMIHVVTDITRQKEIEAELREKNSVIDFAMHNTDVNVWYFDYESKDCQLTQSCQRAHGMQGIEVLKNFPDCLIDQGYVREDCVELFREAYERLQQTGEIVEFDVWFRNADGSGWWCGRDMLSPLTNVDGRITRCVGIGKNVTSEKILEEKFQAFGAYRRLAEKNTRVSFRMNLTTGWFGDCVSCVQKLRERYPVDTIAEFTELFRKRIATDDERAQFDQTLTREKLLEAFARGDNLQEMECHFYVETDRTIWMRIAVEMMRNPVTNEVEGLFYTFDVDHEKNMQCLVQKLLDDDYEFLGLIDLLTGRVMVFGDNAYVPGMAVNGAVYEEEAKRIFRHLISDEYYEESVRSMSCANIVEELRLRTHYTCSFPAKAHAHTQAGRKQWKFSYLDETKTKILMVRTDITSLYTIEYDALSGLYNRETFYERIRKLLDANPLETFILVRLDLDRFKAYNDIYGIQAGDRLLAAIGQIARSQTWPENTVLGRLEADHFAFVTPAKTFNVDEWSARHVQWLKDVSEGYRLGSSVGIYQIRDHSVEISLMCDRALLALRTVKDSYTQKIAWYDESLRDRLMSEQSLADGMERALETEQFMLFFQPQINYDTGVVTGAEVLVRWQHPVRGLMLPGSFIPLLEKNGFILKLDMFVWEKSCAYLREWLDAGKNVVPISVNVSRCNLYEPNLCEKIRNLLTKYVIPVSLVRIEITETAYMDDPEQLMSVVQELRAAGFVVEMDDFGSGYSSLNMLKEIPVDTLKMDARFISESERDERAATILSSIIHMAHRLGLSVIAEGVETKAQADFLKRLRCINMQGYYFARPMPVRAFEKILDDSHPERLFKVRAPQ